MGSGAILRVIAGGITLICWAMTVYKLRDLIRDPRNPALRSLWTAMAAVTLAMTLQPLASTLDNLVGILDVGRITANCLTLVAAAAAQAFLLHLTSHERPVHRKVRLRYALMWAGVATLTAAFALTPKPYRPDDPHVTSGEYAYSGEVAGYTYLYLALLAWPMYEVGVLAARYAPHAAKPLLRIGLRTIAVGTILAGGYLLLKTAQGFVEPGSSGASVVGTAIAASFTSSVLVILLGSTLPSWGPLLGLDRLWEFVADYRACRQLTPLWADVTMLNPAMALLPEQSGLMGRWRTFRDVRVHLARRMVELNDGFRAEVRPYTRIAAGNGIDHEATRVATIVADAVDGHMRGRPPSADADRFSLNARDTNSETPGDELTWLLAVAHAYRRVRRNAAMPRLKTTPSDPTGSAQP